MTAAAQPSSTRVGRISQLDKSTLLKLQAGCNYINEQVSRARTIVYYAIAGGALLGFFLLTTVEDKDPRLWLGVPFVLVSIVYGWQQRRVSKEYKHIVVGRVVKALGHGLTFSRESVFTKNDFNEMDLYSRKAEIWKAEDEVRGQKNAVTYCVLEAKAARREGTGKRRRTVTIFRGLIIRLDFNKHFQGHTIVVPDSESKILGGLFGEADSRNRKEICRLDNPEFENVFSVYSTDQQEARYILTPKLMELVLRARTLFHEGVRVSFHHNSVFVTIPQKSDRFEAKLFGAAVTPESAAGELAEVIRLAEQMLETLDLETRIWTRV